MNRDFTAAAPGQLVVADSTYVPLHGGGFAYTAFCIDACAGLIAGWECSLSREMPFVARAIRQAAALRSRQGHPIGGQAIAHSDAGSRSTRRCATPRRAVGDAYDNALAETTIGLYKTECTRDGSPFRSGPIATLADLEEITSAWVHWYNNHRLMHRLGRRPRPGPRPSTTSRPRRQAARLDMGPSRRTASSPGGPADQ